MSDEVKDATTDVGAALIAGHKMGERAVVRGDNGKGLPYFIDYEGNLITVEKVLAAPARINQNVQIASFAGLKEYLRVFASKQDTAIFAKGGQWPNPPHIRAVLDYHTVTDGKDDPSWCAHHAVWQWAFSSAWLAWMGINGKQQAQGDFGVFLEEHVQEIAEPHGNVLAAAVAGFEATKEAKFLSVQRIEDGSVNFHYQEEVRGATKEGKLALPKTFTIVVAPFVGLSDAVVLTARLRYRVNPTGLMLWFELTNLNEKLDEFFQHFLGTLSTALADKVNAIVEGHVGV